MKLIQKLDIKYSAGNNKGKRWALFECPVCSSMVERQIHNGLRDKSCGCTREKHGMKNSSLYTVWESMKTRCYNPKHKYYKNYGARGIGVCEQWKNSFTAFMNWSNENGFQENLELDRIENNKGYSPDNCRYVTHEVNCRNQRTTKLDSKRACEIRELYNDYKLSQTIIAELYCVSRSNVQAIVSNKNWKE